MWNFESRLQDYVGSVSATLGTRTRLLNRRPTVRCAAVLSLIAMLFASTTPVHADLSLTVPSATFSTTDGTDTVDVLITGDGSTSFGKFTLNFQITPDASNVLTPLETIQFVAPPSDPSTDPTLNSGNYVFPGNSLKQLISAPFGNVSGPNNTMLSVSDATADGSDVNLASGSKALLAELTFTVPTNITNPGGDKFDVTLVTPNTSPTALESNVSTPSDVSVAGTFAGVITLEQSAAPEPGTLGMLLLGTAGLLWSRRRRA